MFKIFKKLILLLPVSPESLGKIRTQFFKQLVPHGFPASQNHIPPVEDRGLPGGDRPLGLQASQLAAVARWAAAEHENAPVTLVGVGPRSSTFALIAAALEEKAVAGVELHRSLATLKEVIEENWLVTNRPEMFCFGLLEAFDIKQLAAMVAPRPVVRVGR